LASLSLPNPVSKYIQSSFAENTDDPDLVETPGVLIQASGAAIAATAILSPLVSLIEVYLPTDDPAILIFDSFVQGFYALIQTFRKLCK
jgi:hypothetical protein